MKKRYTVRMKSGDTWIMLADMAEASAPLQHEVEGQICWTPFRTASAAHDYRRAAEIVANYLARQSGDNDSVVSVEVQS